MIINCLNISDTQWENYFAFVVQQATNNPFAHTIPAKTAADLKNKVQNRVAKSRGTFFVFTFWENNTCIATIEIAIPPNEQIGYAYLLTAATNNTLGDEISAWLKEFCLTHNLVRMRLTCSTQNTQQLLAQCGFTLIIHDVIQELERKDIDNNKVNMFIDLGYVVLQQNKLSLSFHNFLSDTMLDKYITFHNSVIDDIIVLDKKSGELPVAKESILDRYESVQARGGSVWYFILQNEYKNIVGLTEVWCANAHATIIDGGLTAIAKLYRQKGLALFLKSMMIQKAVNSIPELELINTANSVVNAPILGVNAKLNFKKVSEEFIFEILY